MTVQPPATRLNRAIVFNVANKQLPVTDYRVLYAKASSVADVHFGLPGKPATVDSDHFVRMEFHEGLQVKYLLSSAQLLIYLWRNRSRIDLVHFYSTNLILIGPILATIARLPCIVTVTGFGRVFSSSARRYRALQPLYMLLLRLTILLSFRTLLQNRQDLMLLKRQFPKLAHKLMYVGSAISGPTFPVKSFSGEKLRVIMVARLMPDKGIDDFIKIASHLYERGYEFVLVGPPSDGFDDLLLRVRTAHSRGILQYLGELRYEQLWSEYAKADIGIFTSYAEGMPRVMLEYGLAGLLPIAYDIPSNLDLITDGRGFLTSKGDSDGIIDILTLMLRDRDILAQSATAYQRFVIDNFDLSQYVHRMDQIIETLVLSR